MQNERCKLKLKVDRLANLSVSLQKIERLLVVLYKKLFTSSHVFLTLEKEIFVWEMLVHL